MSPLPPPSIPTPAGPVGIGDRVAFICPGTRKRHEIVVTCIDCADSFLVGRDVKSSNSHGLYASLVTEIIKAEPAKSDAPPPVSTSVSISTLRLGDIIRHASHHRPFVVTATFGDRATAVATVDITNPGEWELVKKASHQDPTPPATRLIGMDPASPAGDGHVEAVIERSADGSTARVVSVSTPLPPSLPSILRVGQRVRVDYPVMTGATFGRLFEDVNHGLWLHPDDAIEADRRVSELLDLGCEITILDPADPHITGPLAELRRTRPWVKGGEKAAEAPSGWAPPSLLSLAVSLIECIAPNRGRARPPFLPSSELHATPLDSTAVFTRFRCQVPCLYDAVRELGEGFMDAAGELIQAVEGPRAPRWASGGLRLKDTREWCEFYVAFNAAKREQAIDERRKLIHPGPPEGCGAQTAAAYWHPASCEARERAFAEREEPATGTSSATPPPLRPAFDGMGRPLFRFGDTVRFIAEGKHLSGVVIGCEDRPQFDRTYRICTNPPSETPSYHVAAAKIMGIPA